ncbi:MAG: AbrB/MazE/SpoVT family DNA-binding domain-containing protein [Deltaproteobacteria bacterium]|nr:AbrB/MazE/SpoVT family DNA-binding domain-containing protein [Deltaproteobacteria bacterium]
MQTAKIFKNGNSQAIRLPKEFRFEGDEVVVKKVGDAVMLFPIRYRAETLKEALDELEPEFRLEREQPEEQQGRDFDE